MLDTQKSTKEWTEPYSKRFKYFGYYSIMPKKPIDFKRPLEIETLRKRLERKMKRRSFTSEQKARLVELLRLRRGLLSPEELQKVKQKILSGETKIAVHLTDIEFLESILKSSLKRAEIFTTTLKFLEVPTSNSFSKAPEFYNKYLKLYSGDPKTLLPVTGEWGGVAKDKKDFIIQFFESKKTGFTVLFKHLTPQRLIFDNKSRVSHAELEYLSKFIIRYKKGDKSFLEDSEIVDKIHEIISRVFARSGYYTIFRRLFKMASAMNIGIIFEETGDSYYGKSYKLDSEDRSCILEGSRIKGFFVPNSVNLSFVLATMFSTAKSIKDIVPIYGDNGKLLWPK